MATFFRTALAPSVGTIETLLAQSGSSARFTIIGFSISNMTEGIVLASVRLEDGTSTSSYYIKDVVLPPNQSLRIVNGGEKLIVGPSSSIFISSNTDSALDAIMSYVEIL